MNLFDKVYEDTLLRHLFSAGRRLPAVDPLTAAMNALAYLNQFLCTPAGQKIALDAESVIVNLLIALHVHVNVPVATPK